MRDLKPPFRFDMTGLLARLRALPVDVDATVEIGLPFFKLKVKPDDIEQRVAREMVIRLSNHRVLNAFECCDGCIDNALESLQKIRQLVVDKQVELADRTDSPLYLLLELIAAGIRQFLTFEESLSRHPDLPRHFDEKDAYFAGLEALRGHIYRTMAQVAVIADMTIPNITEAMRYDSDWDLRAYVEDHRQRALPD